MRGKKARPAPSGAAGAEAGLPSTAERTWWSVNGQLVSEFVVVLLALRVFGADVRCLCGAVGRGRRGAGE